MYDITGAVSLWDHLAETSKPIIIYGMGDGAQKILDVCSLKNVKISGFMASDDFVRGHSFAGFEVKSCPILNGSSVTVSYSLLSALILTM